jgi:hypothetical protein
MPFDTAKAFRKRLGIAMLAAGADLDASADGIPSRVGPFDVGVV